MHLDDILAHLSIKLAMTIRRWEQIIGEVLKAPIDVEVTDRMADDFYIATTGFKDAER